MSVATCHTRCACGHTVFGRRGRFSAVGLRDRTQCAEPHSRPRCQLSTRHGISGGDSRLCVHDSPWIEVECSHFVHSPQLQEVMRGVSMTFGTEVVGCDIVTSVSAVYVQR